MLRPTHLLPRPRTLHHHRRTPSLRLLHTADRLHLMMEALVATELVLTMIASKEYVRKVTILAPRTEEYPRFCPDPYPGECLNVYR